MPIVASRRTWVCLIACMALAVVKADDASRAAPLPQAHAHNDYEHDRPLLDALDHGFTSVEADVFLISGQLLVAHSVADLSPERTLESLYLAPLRKRIQQNEGSVHGDGRPFHLLIDFKSEAERTYQALAPLLAEYDDIITSVRDGQVHQKAVDAVISGNRPIETLKAAAVRHAGFDGRMNDLDSELPAHLMPLVSDRWAGHFEWRGRGAIGEADRAKLLDAVEKTHRRGRRIRFWATPESVAAWTVLHEAGVDHINTDNLAGLERFLRGRTNQ